MTTYTTRATAERTPRGYVPSRVPDRWATIFVAISFLVLTPPRALNAFRLLHIALPLALLAIHLAYKYFEGVGRVRLPTGLVLFVAWCAVTAFWSVAKFNTLLETLVTSILVLLGAIVGSTCGIRNLVAGVMLAGYLILGLSIVVVVVSPSYGLMPAGYQGGALRGIYGHRNLLAEALTVPTVAALVYDFGGPVRWLKRFGTTAGLVLGLVLTESSTAIATVTAVIVVALLLRWYQQTSASQRVVPILGIAAVVTLAMWFIRTNLAEGFALLGRDDTLTGRTPIWAAVQRLIANATAGGYGWGAAWDASSPVEQQVELEVKFVVPSAHNGYLDLWLQVGLVGLIVYLLFLAAVLVKGVIGLTLGSSTLALWPPLLVLTLLFYSIGESSLMSPVALTTLAATAVVFVSSRAFSAE